MPSAAGIVSKGKSVGLKIIGFSVAALLAIGFVLSYAPEETRSEGQPGYVPVEEVEEEQD